MYFLYECYNEEKLINLMKEHKHLKIGEGTKYEEFL